jgi:hypothetical protein
MSLITDLIFGDLRTTQERRSHEAIGPSSARTCIRQLAYKYAHYPATDQVSSAAADLGTLIHDAATARVKAHAAGSIDADVQVTIPGVPRPGRLDVIDWEAREVWDIKTTNARGYDWMLEHGPREEWWGQIDLYILGAVLDDEDGDWTAGILLIDTETKTITDGAGVLTLRHKEFMRPHDPDNARALADTIRTRHEALTAAMTPIQPAITAAAWNEVRDTIWQFPREGRGPGSFPCDWCCAPGTLVLKADWTWIPIEDVQVGDVLVGRDEYGSTEKRAKVRLTTVTATRRRQSPLVRINGGLTVAADKKFAAKRRWTAARTGLNAQFLADPIKRDQRLYERGYLAGMADGDGTFWYANGHHMHRHFRLALTSDAEILLNRFHEYATRAGFPMRRGVHHSRNFDNTESRMMQAIYLQKHQECARFEEWIESLDDESWAWGYIAGITDAEGYVTGRSGTNRSGGIRISQIPEANPETYAKIGRVLQRLAVDASAERKGWYIHTKNGGLWRFLMGATPARPMFTDLALDRRPHNTRKMVCVEQLGEGEVVSLTTDSGTYIAEGWVVHNCPFESDCWPEAAGPAMTPQAETVKDDPDGIGQWAQMYVEARTEESKYKAVKEEAGEFLKGLNGSYRGPDGGTYKVATTGGNPRPDIPDPEGMAAIIDDLGIPIPKKPQQPTARHLDVKKEKP